ncbi:MAG: hypothetical protein ACOYJO_05590 [Eubacterium sp.]|jgi:hypothetical protein
MKNLFTFILHQPVGMGDEYTKAVLRADNNVLMEAAPLYYLNNTAVR